MTATRGGAPRTPARTGGLRGFSGSSRVREAREERGLAREERARRGRGGFKGAQAPGGHVSRACLPWRGGGGARGFLLCAVCQTGEGSGGGLLYTRKKKK